MCRVAVGETVRNVAIKPTCEGVAVFIHRHCASLEWPVEVAGQVRITGKGGRLLRPEFKHGGDDYLFSALMMRLASRRWTNAVRTQPCGSSLYWRVDMSSDSVH